MPCNLNGQAGRVYPIPQDLAVRRCVRELGDELERDESGEQRGGADGSGPDPGDVPTGQSGADCQKQ
jgi:hypothetical protein